MMLLEVIVPLNGVYGDLILTYPKPYSIYLRGTIYCFLEVRVPASGARRYRRGASNLLSSFRPHVKKKGEQDAFDA